MRRSLLVVLFLISSMFAASCQSLAYTTPVEIDPDAELFCISMAYQKNLVRLSNDTLVCVYFDSGNDLSYVLSKDDGVSWTEKGIIDADLPEFIGGVSIARDGNDLIWCAYTDEDEETDDNFVRISVYWEGAWSPGLRIDPPEDGDEQVGPYVAVNSTNEIFVAWNEYNHTDDWIEVINFSFDQFPLDMPEPMTINNSGDPTEDGEWCPVLALDGNDTVHAAYIFSNHTTDFIRYANRTVGASEFSTPINLSMDDYTYDMYPSMCINESGTVFISVTYGRGSIDYMVGLFYGNPPTHKMNISDEVDYICDLYEVSIAWYDGELHILHDDYTTYQIAHVSGTPESGWTLTTSISEGAFLYEEGFHTHPSLRWAYYHEPTNTLDYVFVGYIDIFEEGATTDLFYQDIIGSDVPLIDTDPYVALTSMVISATSLLLVVVILRGVVKNISKMGRSWS